MHIVYFYTNYGHIAKIKSQGLCNHPVAFCLVDFDCITKGCGPHLVTPHTDPVHWSDLGAIPTMYICVIPYSLKSSCHIEDLGSPLRGYCGFKC